MGHIWLPIRSDSGAWSSIEFLFSHFIPIELAPNAIFVNQLMAEERGLVVDIEGFNIAMNEARERSRNAQNKVAVFVLFLLFWASYRDVFVMHILLCASCTREKNGKKEEKCLQDENKALEVHNT